MKNPLELIKSLANFVLQEPGLGRWLIAVLAAIFLLQFYFVRELLVVELFFALGFAVLLLLGGPAYLIGSAGVSWLVQPRSSQAKATSPLGHSAPRDRRSLAPETLRLLPGKGEDVEAVERFGVTGRYAIEQKEERPHVMSI